MRKLRYGSGDLKGIASSIIGLIVIVIVIVGVGGSVNLSGDGNLKMFAKWFKF